LKKQSETVQSFPVMAFLHRYSGERFSDFHSIRLQLDEDVLESEGQLEQKLRSEN
jgi:hypothetical protein